MLNHYDKQVYEVEVEDNGRQLWRQNGELHRLDGPAVIWADGPGHWYQNGLLHRLDGPALIYSDGYEAWYKDGQLHRLDGPAIIKANGDKYWYIEGAKYTQSEYEALTLKQSKPWKGKKVVVDGVEYTLS